MADPGVHLFALGFLDIEGHQVVLILLVEGDSENGVDVEDAFGAVVQRGDFRAEFVANEGLALGDEV